MGYNKKIYSIVKINYNYARSMEGGGYTAMMKKISEKLFSTIENSYTFHFFPAA